MESLNVETLNEATKKFTARFERVTQEGIDAVRERSRAFQDAYKAQCGLGRELVQKSREVVEEFRKLAPKPLKTVGGAVATTVRKSVDLWIDVAGSSLGRARQVLQAALDTRPNA